MSRLTLQDILQIEGVMPSQPRVLGALRNGTGITGVSIDSRTIKHGEMFFAIKGERFDGHSFLKDVINKGCKTVVVSLDWEPPSSSEWDEVIILHVPDTTHALGDLAAIHRKKFAFPIVAVTGTNGKTTTKEMIFSVLSQRLRVVKSQGNYNNQYGVPLTLFQLTGDTEIAVAELGASYPGDIAQLCGIALPTHGVITNIGKGHIEFFKTEDEVVHTKTALLHAIKNRGAGFINGDDTRLKPLAGQFDNVQTFGLGAGVNFRGENPVMQPDGGFVFTINYKGRSKTSHSSLMKIRLSVPGRNNMYNALAAAAVGLNFGLDETAVREGLESFTSFSQRMEIKKWNGVKIINDSYNANPDSMVAALELLMEFPSTGKRFTVLGDMLELGAVSKKEHESIGRKAAALSVDRLITVGRDARFISESARDAGLRASEHVDDYHKAAMLLRAELQLGDVMLIKGSRGSTMEKVLEYLYQK